MQYETPTPGSFLTVYLVDDLERWASCRMSLSQNCLGAYLKVIPDTDDEYLNEIHPNFVRDYLGLTGPPLMRDVHRRVQRSFLVPPDDLSQDPEDQGTRSWIFPSNPLTAWIAVDKNKCPCVWVWSSDAALPTEVYQTYPLDPNDFVVGLFVTGYSVCVIMLNEVKKFNVPSPSSKRRKLTSARAVD
jgi:hypothetical protein